MLSSNNKKRVLLPEQLKEYKKQVLNVVEGLSETSSLPCRGKVCVYTTLPRPHSWNYTGYIVVVVVKEYKKQALQLSIYLRGNTMSY